MSHVIIEKVQSEWLYFIYKVTWNINEWVMMISANSWESTEWMIILIQGHMKYESTMIQGHITYEWMWVMISVN